MMDGMKLVSITKIRDNFRAIYDIMIFWHFSLLLENVFMFYRVFEKESAKLHKCVAKIILNKKV